MRDLRCSLALSPQKQTFQLPNLLPTIIQLKPIRTILLAFFLLGGISALAATAPVLVDDKEFQLWLLYPTEKVFKDQLLPTDSKLRTISLSCAKGEFEPFIVVVRPRHRKPLMDVRFDLEPFRSGKGASPLTLEYERVGYINIDVPSGTSIFPDMRHRFKDTALPFGSSARRGYFPDRLIPESITAAPPGENPYPSPLKSPSTTSLFPPLPHKKILPAGAHNSLRTSGARLSSRLSTAIWLSTARHQTPSSLSPNSRFLKTVESSSTPQNTTRCSNTA